MCKRQRYPAQLSWLARSYDHQQCNDDSAGTNRLGKLCRIIFHVGKKQILGEGATTGAAAVAETLEPGYSLATTGLVATFTGGKNFTGTCVTAQ